MDTRAEVIDTLLLPSGKAIVSMPLPPGTNHRLMPAHGRLILSRDARGFLDTVGTALRFWRARHGFQTITEHTALEVWVVMGRVGSDSHNYLKELCDVLEVAKIVENDSLLLPQIKGIYHNSKSPEIIIKL